MSQTEKLQHRAEHLRREAHGVPSLLAQAYRRRASELELQAFLLDTSVPLAA